MKVKFDKAARADGVAYKKGAVATISERAAKKLLSRGYVSKWTGQKKEAEDAAPSGE